MRNLANNNENLLAGSVAQRSLRGNCIWFERCVGLGVESDLFQCLFLLFQYPFASQRQVEVDVYHHFLRGAPRTLLLYDLGISLNSCIRYVAIR